MEQIVFALTQVFFLGMFILLGTTVALTGVFFAKQRTRGAALSFAPPVSVVIPAYNEESRIGKCLETIFSSEYEGGIEVIVVDDGSTDRTREIAGRYPVTVLKQNHEGKVAALNRGIAVAMHDFVLTIDADTFLKKNTIQEIVRPLKNKSVGAVSGIANVYNRKSVLGAFQSVEYPYISFLREVFSSLFRVAPGICGALTVYRKSVLEEVGGFKKNTVLEDFDVSFHIVKRGYDVVTTPRAIGDTVVPGQIGGLFKQRVRWLKGSMQCVLAHKDVFAKKKLTMNYILAGQLFWFVYSFFALPLILFHMAYWLPANSATLLDTGWYFFRWFSLAGVAYMIWMIPVWGINWVYIFGVLAGIVSSGFYLLAIQRYDKIGWRNALAVFFFFPYTLVMSVFMMGGVISFFASKGKGTFIS